MEKQSLSQAIIRNTIYNIVGHFWGILVVLILTPYIIYHIGIERYGIWAIVGVITGYFGLLDFGIGTSFVKYIAEFYAKKDYDKINQVVNTGFIFYSIFAILIIILAFFIINPLLTLFKIPAHLYNEALFVFLLGIVLFGVSNALSPFSAIQGGLQRMDITNKVSISVSIPMILGTVFFLESGYGLPGLMVNNAIILAISSIINIIIAFKILPELRFTPSLFISKEALKKLFNFGYKLQIARISSMISVHIDKILIGHFLSVGLVTFYQLGSSIIEQAKMIVLFFVSALIPAFSEIDARGERKKLIEGYIRGTKYLGLIAIPLFTFVIISAPHIMVLWMGSGYEKSAWVIQILGLAWLPAVLCGMRAVIVQAIAKPEIEMKAGLVAAIFNIPLSIIFIIYFGFMGVVLGTSVALVFSVIYGTVKLHQEIQLSIAHFVKTTILKPIAICVCLGLIFWGLTNLFQGVLLECGQVTNIGVFLMQSLLFCGSYLIIMLYVKPFDNVDFMMLVKNRPLLIQHLMMKFSREIER